MDIIIIYSDELTNLIMVLGHLATSFIYIYNIQLGIL
jgi:hypothetical protein